MKGDRGKEGLTFGVLRLGEQARAFAGDSGETELALVILSGRCVIEAGSMKWGPIGTRDTVFSGKATGVYIPPYTDYRVYPVGRVEVAISGVPSDIKGEPQIVTPDHVVVNTRGVGNFTREVHDIIALNVKAQKLVVGETFTPQGNWSSYPPHKHDVDDFPNEVKMEELYFFKVNPPQGFGVQIIYGSAGQSGRETCAAEGGELLIGNGGAYCENAYVIRDNDVVLIESGYHPVVAAPGYAIYYLWVLAGENRMLVPRDDPDHVWIKEKPELGAREQ
ncbi:MAG TPA: 5-deoxy-glucuronate isomerase [Firmicutes bacterium]|nr:5-deoxy-glucuronate isomerase [Bacillota bacterium]